MIRIEINTKGIFLLALFIFGLSAAGLGAEKTAADSSAPIARLQVEYGAEGLRDPFQSVLPEVNPTAEEPVVSEEPAGPPPNLVVQGLIWGGSVPQAIINNQVVRTGDLVEGARVIGIDKNGATVFFQGKKYRVSSSAAEDKRGGSKK